MINIKPLITIVMAVYNGEQYIEETIESLLNQSYKNIELIIVDDGSKDNTAEIIQTFHDSRIKLLKNDENMRLAYSLNKAIQVSTGKYIARMDADDICIKDRLDMQVEYMESNPAVAVLSGLAKQFGSSNRLMHFPVEHEAIKIELLFGNPMCHPAVMFRRNQIPEWYNNAVVAAQDYELWSRLIWKVHFYNLPQVLVRYRIHESQTRNTLGKSQKQGALLAFKNMLAVLGQYSNEDVKLLADAGDRNTGKSIAELQKMCTLYNRILHDAQQKKGLFQTDLLEKRIEEQKAILVYASLIYKTIRWSDIPESKMLRSFLQQPLLVIKAVVHSIQRK
ncbi:MAG TPA: hypothetical protein DC053_09270 [Lachnoclostridium sp.]|nr:hypothetical protein [Lachnoclostridium sp.]